MANTLRKFENLDDGTRASNMFWKSEYLKRHLWLSKNTIIQNTFAASNNVFNQLRKNNELNEISDKDILTLAINQSIIMLFNSTF